MTAEKREKKFMNTSRGFNPLEHYTVSLNENDVPKFVPKTYKGMPLFNSDGEQILVPATHMKWRKLILWFRTEYPTGIIQTERTTESPVWSDEMQDFIYPRETCRCRIWTDRNSASPDMPDAEATAIAERKMDQKYDPYSLAKAMAVTDALTLLGFACDIEEEDTWKGLPETVDRQQLGMKIKGGTDTLEEIRPGTGEYIQTFDPVSSSRISGNINIRELDKTVREAQKKVAEAFSNHEQCSHAANEKENSGSKPKEKPEDEKESNLTHIQMPANDSAQMSISVDSSGPSAEKESVSSLTPAETNIVPNAEKNQKKQEKKGDSEYRKALKTPLEVLDPQKAGEAVARFDGQPMGEIYKAAKGLIKVLARPTYNPEGKVSQASVDAAIVLSNSRKQVTI